MNIKQHTPPVEWTAKNQHEAQHEGWDVFQADDEIGGGRVLRIQRLDTPHDADPALPLAPMFACDVAAIAFVKTKAAEGSVLHQTALQLDGFIMWEPA